MRLALLRRRTELGSLFPLYFVWRHLFWISIGLHAILRRTGIPYIAAEHSDTAVISTFTAVYYKYYWFHISRSFIQHYQSVVYCSAVSYTK